LPVRGRPILDWSLRALPGSIDRVLVVVHYKGEQIEAYLGTQDHVPDWEVIRQEVPRGTGDALRACRGRLRGGSFLVLNGDDLYGAADLVRLAACAAGVLVHPVDEPEKYGVAYLREDGRLERLVEKKKAPAPQLANTGAYCFPEHVFATELALSPRGEYEITDYVTSLARDGTVEVVQAGFWLPIGTVEAWQAAQELELAEVLAGRR
jgi:NDP-sugar pyrophosphorylase family protein